MKWIDSVGNAGDAGVGLSDGFIVIQWYRLPRCYWSGASAASLLPRPLLRLCESNRAIAVSGFAVCSLLLMAIF